MEIVGSLLITLFRLQVTSCDHSFCRACLLGITPALRTVSCPSCSKPLTVDLTTANSGEKRVENSVKSFKHSSILNRLDIQNFKTSTKIDALVLFSTLTGFMKNALILFSTIGI